MRTFTLLVLLAACKGGDDTGAQPPTVAIDPLDYRDLDFDGVDATTALAVTHPGDASVSGLTWELAFAGTAIASGDASDWLDGTTFAPKLSLDLVWDDVWAVATAPVGQDDVAYTLSGTVSFDDGETAPFSDDGTFPAVRRPVMTLGKLDLRDSDPFTGDATVRLDVYGSNPHATTLFWRSVDHTLTFDGSQVSSGVIETLGHVDSQAPGLMYYEFATNLDNDMEPATADALQTGGTVSVRFTATASVETPWGDLPLSWDLTGDVQVK